MSSEEQLVGASQEFPGKEFSRAREAQGLSFDQLSRELRLPMRTLQAIEAASFDGLGGPVFVRGYIRAYARRLKLDPVPFVTAFDACAGIQEVTATVRAVGSVATTPARQSRFLMRFGTVLFLLVIIAIVIWWWRAQYSLEGVLIEQSSAPVAVDTADGNTLILPPLNDPEPTAAGVEQVAPAASAETAEEVSLNLDTLESAPQKAPVEDEAPVLAASAVSVESAAAEEVAEVEKSLRIDLTQDSWLRITDAGGTSLFNGIAKGGSDLAFEGREPLSVVIGRADAVARIEYAGVPVDLTGVSSKNVAHLTLPRVSLQ